VGYGHGQGLAITVNIGAEKAALCATVAVTKPSAEVSATNSQLYCGETSQLKRASSDAPQVEIRPASTVVASGEQTVHQLGLHLDI
jgi:hypothetical protein